MLLYSEETLPPLPKLIPDLKSGHQIHFKPNILTKSDKNISLVFFSFYFS